MAGVGRLTMAREDIGTRDYKISLAVPEDIPGIITLQDPNVIDHGGTLSVRLTADWIGRSMCEMPIIVGRRDGKVVGYLLSTTIAAMSHVPIIQAMLCRFPPPVDCYLYGPVCVDTTERGKGLAARLYEALRARLPGRPAMTFVRADNTASLRAHRKMGMRELGTFLSDGVPHNAFTYTG
jgi:ribosomal protein S18 acetylase RimI-like enzyme